MDDVAALLKTMRARLKAAADPEFEAGLRWFFKEPVKPYGVRTPLASGACAAGVREVKQWPVGRPRPVRYRAVEERHAGRRRAGRATFTGDSRNPATSANFGCSSSGWTATSRNWSQLRRRVHVVDRGFDCESAGLGGPAGRLDEIEKSMEAAIGGGFADPGSEARPQHRDNFPHLRFIARAMPTIWCKRGSAGC